MADEGAEIQVQARLAKILGPDSSVAELEALRDAFTRFMLQYKFAIEEVLTKVNILRDEFTHLHHENPIEHVTSRLKSPGSVLDKVERKGCDATFKAIRDTILDIAGVRIVCSFVPDIYQVLDALQKQDDLTIIDVKDYIANPKPNGYRSLHMIVSVPVFLSSGTVPVTVEIQIRTIAMDFWASLEHKIYYKYDRQVPASILEGLAESAQVAHSLDTKMTSLRDEVRQIDIAYGSASPGDADPRFVDPRPASVAPDESIVPALDLIKRLAELRSRG
ncbi:putative GTP pyrophosphokinase [Micrococcales bacterium KH10]|nr:putative GTP pyrophosphokinase [Micrococcales bacterium KH10]